MTRFCADVSPLLYAPTTKANVVAMKEKKREKYSTHRGQAAINYADQFCECTRCLVRPFDSVGALGNQHVAGEAREL